MKKLQLLLLTLLIPFLGFTQTDSWINIHLQTDNYPSETSWEILNDTGAIIAVNGPLTSISLHNLYVTLNSGTYTVNLYDSYGDGLGGSGTGTT